MFNFAVDNGAIVKAADNVKANDSQLDAARSSALRKMRKRLETKIKRVAARELRIPQRALEGRFFSNSVAPGDDELRIWIGTWNISPYSIGAVSAYGIPGKSGGVRAGKRRYPGAFISSIYSGQEKVWIRLRSRHYTPELYPTDKRPGNRGMDNTGRFPVVRASVPIDAVLRKILERDGEEMAQEFVTVLAQELNYQVFVKGGN